MFLRIQLLHQVVLHGPAGSLLNGAVLIAYIAVESGADRFRIFGILPQQHCQLRTVLRDNGPVGQQIPQVQLSTQHVALVQQRCTANNYRAGKSALFQQIRLLADAFFQIDHAELHSIRIVRHGKDQVFFCVRNIGVTQKCLITDAPFTKLHALGGILCGNGHLGTYRDLILPIRVLGNGIGNILQIAVLILHRHTGQGTIGNLQLTLRCLLLRLRAATTGVSTGICTTSILTGIGIRGRGQFCSYGDSSFAAGHGIACLGQRSIQLILACRSKGYADFVSAALQAVQIQFEVLVGHILPVAIELIFQLLHTACRAGKARLCGHIRICIIVCSDLDLKLLRRIGLNVCSCRGDLNCGVHISSNCIIIFAICQLLAVLIGHCCGQGLLAICLRGDAELIACFTATKFNRYSTLGNLLPRVARVCWIRILPLDLFVFITKAELAGALVAVIVGGNGHSKGMGFILLNSLVVQVSKGNGRIYIFVYLKGLAVAAILNFIVAGILHNSSQGHGCIIGILGNSNTESHAAHGINVKGIRHFLPLARSAVVVFQLCIGAVAQCQGHGCICIRVLITSQGKLMLLASLNFFSISSKVVDFHAGG